MKTLFTYLIFIFAAIQLNAGTITVQNLNDSGAGSLRQATIDALDGDTIRFDPTLISAGNDTIHLNTEITISSKALVIKGLYNNNDSLFISGDNTTRMFNVANLGNARSFILDSVCLVNGNADNGGAIYFFEGRFLKIFNSLLKNNHCTNQGGAIYSRSNSGSGWGTPPPSEVIIFNCQVYNNTSSSSGGVVNYLSPSNARPVLFDSCVIYNNHAANGGVAYVFNSDGARVNFENCSIYNNSATDIGGVVYLYSSGGSSSTQMYDCTIENNSASSGGVAYVRCNEQDRSASVFLERTSLINNSATNRGGALEITSGFDAASSLYMVKSTIAENTSVGQGGAVYITSVDGTSLNILNSTISDNSGTNGGAIYATTGFASYNYFTVNNSTISNNFSTSDEANGIYASSGGGIGSTNMTLESSIIFNDTNNIVINSTSNYYSQGYNIFSDSIPGLQTSDMVVTDSSILNLLPLGNYGGPTPTVLPGPFSLAINNGNPSDNSSAQNDTISGIRDVGAAENRNVYWIDTLSNCDSLTWIDGITYEEDTVGAIYTFDSALDSGFDSVVKLDLDILISTYSSILPSACYEYTSPSGNYTWTASGEYQDTLINVEGCDSIITIDLSINKTEANISTNACQELVSPSGNYTWTTSGIYNDTITNVAGCDSIMTFDLTIYQPNSGVETVSACESYTWIDGNTYTSNNNTATYTLNNQFGCDSIVTLDLTINQSNSGTDVQSACESLTWIDGNTYTADNNSATYTLTNQLGCDSVVTLDLTINNVNVSTTNLSPTLSADENGAIYQWLDCDENFSPINGATAQTYMANDNGSYAVEVTVNGCSDTSECMIVNNIGLSNEAKQIITIFPNPTTGIFFVKSPKEVSAEVFDAMGRKIISTGSSQEHKIDLSNQGTGVYIIRLKGNNINETHRILVGG